MKEIRHIIAAFDQIDFSKNKAALAMVARVEGSSYRRTGARMLVLDNGTYFGGISGGCLEGDALRRAQKAIASNQASVVTYDTTRDDDEQIGVGLGCNGIIDVLFMPLDPNDVANAVAVIRALAFSRNPRLLATVTSCDHQHTLGRSLAFEKPDQWRRDFAVPELAETVLRDVEQGLKSLDTQTLFYATANGNEVRICLEVLLPAIQVVLFGSNHDIYPLSRLAQELGWELKIVANPLKVDKSLAAMGVRVLPPDSLEKLEIDPYTAVVLMAHDYKTDLSNLLRVLPSVTSYIGLLGPRKRARKMFADLETAGQALSDQQMERIFAPAGLDIGALSPEEIALSIVAEIRAHFSGRLGNSLRGRESAIHEGD